MHFLGKIIETAAATCKRPVGDDTQSATATGGGGKCSAAVAVVDGRSEQQNKRGRRRAAATGDGKDARKEKGGWVGGWERRCVCSVVAVVVLKSDGSRRVEAQSLSKPQSRKEPNAAAATSSFTAKF